jgi:tRNA(fMet)-specific endonuclease VapC
MRYMLDTNICIYLIRRHPREVLAKLADCLENDVVMSAITLAELRYGVECRAADRTVQEDQVAALLEAVPAVAFDQDAAVAYGPVRFATRERTTDALDKLIAAHALSLGLTLVTNNEQDFRAYPGLLIENWASTVSA